MGVYFYIQAALTFWYALVHPPHLLQLMHIIMWQKRWRTDQTGQMWPSSVF